MSISNQAVFVLVLAKLSYQTKMLCREKGYEFCRMQYDFVQEQSRVQDRYRFQTKLNLTLIKVNKEVSLF